MLLGLAAGPVLAASSVWERQPDLPVGIAGFALAVHDDSLHVAGGSAWEDNAKLTLDRRWVWREGDSSWTEQPQLSRPFAYGAYGVSGDTLVFAGGTNGITTCDDVTAVDPEGAVRKSSTMPQPTAYCGSAMSGDTLYVLGGTTDIDDLTKLHASFIVIDLQRNCLERLPDYPGGPVLHPRPVMLNGEIIVFPGGAYDASQRRAVNGSAVWAYEPATRRWTPRASYPFAVRGIAACALDSNRHALIAGGVRTHPNGETAMTGECFLYDAANDRFHVLPALPHAAALMGSARIGEWVYVLGGEDRPQHRSVAVFRARISDLLASLPHPG